MGVKPSEATLSEQDFMQSNGEEVVEEPVGTRVSHGIDESMIVFNLGGDYVEMWLKAVNEDEKKRQR